MFNTLLTTIENGVCIITVNRPDKLNALNHVVIDELAAAIDTIYTNPGIRSAIITGAGSKSFVAGADITEFLELDANGGAALAQRGQEMVFNKIEQSPKPIIAAVNGFALGGGCELAMACHFRVAATNAKFGQPEVNLGLIPGYGGTQRLTLLIGKGRALEMMMTGNMIDAQTALQYGLVNHVVEPDQLLQKAVSILELINSKAPLAIARCIACANAAADPAQDGYAAEIKAFGDCFATADKVEGTTAFLEKRKPVFSGK